MGNYKIWLIDNNYYGGWYNRLPTEEELSEPNPRISEDNSVSGDDDES